MKDERSPALSWRLTVAFQGKLEWFGRCLGAGRGTQRRKVDQEKREGKAKGPGMEEAACAAVVLV